MHSFPSGLMVDQLYLLSETFLLCTSWSLITSLCLDDHGGQGHGGEGVSVPQLTGEDKKKMKNKKA